MAAVLHCRVGTASPGAENEMKKAREPLGEGATEILAG